MNGLPHLENHEKVYFIRDLNIDSHNANQNNSYTIPVSGKYIVQRRGNIVVNFLEAGDCLWDVGLIFRIN